MRDRIRVLIVDDHAIVRRGILAKLGLASRTQAALFAVEHRPDAPP